MKFAGFIEAVVHQKKKWDFLMGSRKWGSVHFCLLSTLYNGNAGHFLMWFLFLTSLQGYKKVELFMPDICQPTVVCTRRVVYHGVHCLRRDFKSSHEKRENQLVRHSLVLLAVNARARLVSSQRLQVMYT